MEILFTNCTYIHDCWCGPGPSGVITFKSNNLSNSAQRDATILQATLPKGVFEKALLLLLLLLVETKTAAQHSCHMLQVRDFKGTLLGIGSKVWRDVSSWTSYRCGTQVLVGLFLVFDAFWGVVLEGGSKNYNGLQILYLGGVETTTSFEGGSKKTTTGLQLLSLGCGRGSK